MNPYAAIDEACAAMEERSSEAAVREEDYFAFPLTAAQALMLPQSLGEIADPRYNGSFRVALSGRIDPGLLEESFCTLAQRHEVLRARLSLVNSVPQQIILPHSAVHLGIVNLRSFSSEDRHARMEAFCQQEATTGFNLATDTPLRLHLLHLEEEEAVLTLTIHQIYCDGWSIGLLLEDLVQIYPALAKHQRPSLPPVTFDFGDYITWQEESAASAQIAGQQTYWQRKLAGYRPLSVSPDLAPQSSSIHSDIVSHLLSRELIGRLQQLQQAQSTTFFAITVAACMVLLHRYTGKTDIAVQTPLAGRSRVEFEPVVGQFVNQVAIRSDLAGNPTLLDALSRVRESVWEALANQDAPLTNQPSNLASSTDENLASRFPVNFVCQQEYGRRSTGHYDFGGTRLTTLPSKSQGALYELNFFLVERPAGWRLSLEYKTDLYERATAESLLAHFEQVLDVISHQPHLTLADVVLSETEALQSRTRHSESSLSVISPDAVELAEEPFIHAMPSSFAQERFWALSQVDPSDPTFHVPLVMNVSGELSAPLLEKSFQLLIDRHEILRTTFLAVDDELSQVISGGYAFTLECISVEEDREPGLSTRLNAIVRAEVTRPFDLAQLPLLRALLCRIGPSEHLLAITIHHILADGRSVQVLQSELWAVYESLRSSQPISVAPLTLQYADFAAWQREAVSSELAKKDLQFWLQTLRGPLPVLDFPTAYPSGHLLPPRGEVETLQMPEDLLMGMKQLAQSSNTTFFVVALACFGIVLSRATGAEDAVVGSPLLNRNAETEDLIGCFAGPMALRLDLTADPFLRDLIDRTRKTTLSALQHSNIPFELILQNLQVRPVHGKSPLFQFYFFSQKAFLQSHALPGLTIVPRPSMSIGTPFEMQWSVIERPDGTRTEVEYNANLFDSETVQQWLGYYHSVVAALLANPDRKLSTIPVPSFPASSFVASSPEPPQPISAGSQPAWGAPSASSLVTAEHSLAGGTVLNGTAHAALRHDLLEMWRSALHRPDIGPEEDFFELGGRSLTAARLMTKINERFKLKLGLSTLFQCPTVNRMLTLIESQGSVEHPVSVPRPSSVVVIQPQGTALPLFMIHGAGGNVLNFYDLSKKLGPSQPLYGIEAQALIKDEAPLTDIETLARYYLQEVKLVQPSGPYQFVGYSYGGLLAYEMACQVSRQNETVALLGILDTPVWRHDMKKPSGMVGMLQKQGKAIWLPFFQRFRSFNLKEVYAAGKSTLVRAAYAVLLARGRNIPGFLRSAYQINSFAAVSYVPEFYAGKITVLQAAAERGPEDLGWNKFTSEPARVFKFPGQHLQILEESNLPLVAEALRECLVG